MGFILCKNMLGKEWTAFQSTIPPLILDHLSKIIHQSTNSITVINAMTESMYSTSSRNKTIAWNKNLKMLQHDRHFFVDSPNTFRLFWIIWIIVFIININNFLNTNCTSAAILWEYALVNSVRITGYLRSWATSMHFSAILQASPLFVYVGETEAICNFHSSPLELGKANKKSDSEVGRHHFRVSRHRFYISQSTTIRCGDGCQQHVETSNADEFWTLFTAFE